MTDDQNEDVCSLCAAAGSTALNRLLDAVNDCLEHAQLDPYENLGALTIKCAKLDLRKLLDMLKVDEMAIFKA